MPEAARKVKCVVWDLDNTVWNGTLLEDEEVRLNQDAVSTIKELDRRGILNSVCSKNDGDFAMEKLRQFGIAEYFLYPQISWDAKSESVRKIAQQINIGIDTIAFIDDQPYELDEVSFHCPEVRCFSADRIHGLLEQPEFTPDFITVDAQHRRQMYLSNIRRQKSEDSFSGPKEGFLKSLDMVFSIKEADYSDLKRVEELAARTHQLNTTGYTYAFDELCAMMESPRYKLWVAGLDDKFGTYGKIGIALAECMDDRWIIKLFLMSCRVMSRGVGSVFINYLINCAKEAGKSVYAEFLPTDRNRMMLITYRFMGFQEDHTTGDLMYLKYDFGTVHEYPAYIRLVLPDQNAAPLCEQQG